MHHLVRITGLLTVAALSSAAPAAPGPTSAPAWGSAEMDAPLGVAARDGFVYVADFHNRRVLKLGSSGDPLFEWGAAGSGDGRLEGPAAVAVDARGDLYVADVLQHAVSRFAADGRLLARFGSWGSGPGQFSGPFGIAVGAAGDVYVTDLDNHRVQRFTSDGVFISSWGAHGRGAGQLSDPWGIAVDSRGDVVVADHANHRLQKFTADGRFLAEWSAVGDGVRLFGPVGVAIGADDAVFVTDLGDAMVWKLSADGKPAARWSADDLSHPADLRAVAVAGAQLYVTDAGRHRVTRLVDSEASRGRAPAAFALSTAWPNPSHGSATMTFAIPTAARLRADVLDIHGRHVRRLADQNFEPGEHTLVWNGRADDGNAAPAGIYFIRGSLEGAARVLRTRVAIVR